MTMPFVEAADSGTNPAILLGIISLVGVGITALTSYLSARFAGKQADKAASITQANVAKQADTDGWDKLVSALQGELKRLGDRVAGLEEQGEEDRARIVKLEGAVRDGDVKYRVALQYIHDVIAWTKKIFNTDQVPPAAPPLIATDLEMH